MGAAAPVLPYIAAAVAGGASYVNTRNTARAQDKVLAQGIREKNRRQADADKKTNELIDKTAQSNPRDEINQAMQRFTQSLGQGRQLANSSLGSVGGEQYREDANNAALGIADYGNKIASLMSRIDGPVQQRRNEGNMTNDYAVDIDRIKRFSEGDDFLNRMKLQGIRRNPLLDALSAAAGAYATAGSFGSGAGAGAPATGGGVPGNGLIFPFG